MENRTVVGKVTDDERMSIDYNNTKLSNFRQVTRTFEFPENTNEEIKVAYESENNTEFLNSLKEFRKNL